MIIGLSVLLVIYLVISVWITYHKVIDLKNNVEKAYANINILLLKRAELIPELVQLDEYQQQEWQKVMNQLQSVEFQSPNQQVILHNQLMDESLSLIEMNTNATLMQLNEGIAHRRMFYNDSVQLFNRCFDAFPHSYLIKLLGFQPMQLLRK